MRSFVQYVQFLMNQSDNSTSHALTDSQGSVSRTNLVPYLYSSYSSLTKNLDLTGSDARHLQHAHRHSKLSPVPDNTRDDLETTAFLALLFFAVFLLRGRGIKVSEGRLWPDDRPQKAAEHCYRSNPTNLSANY